MVNSIPSAPSPRLRLWLLLCYAQYARSDFLDLMPISTVHQDPAKWTVPLPVVLGVDQSSGCICRANDLRSLVVCFGGHECKKFPKVSLRSDTLRVRTSTIETIRAGELDYLFYLKVLELESNHRLKHIQPGSFQKLTHLEVLTISFSTALHYLESNTFDGLSHLRTLIMVNNGFTSISNITSMLSPWTLPYLEILDLSENIFPVIPRDAFASMKGTKLRRLGLNLCQTEYLHHESLLPLKYLKELSIRENELNSSLIKDVLVQLLQHNVNLSYLDLSGMGFRRHPPKELMVVIAKTTIKILLLANNQFEVILYDSFPPMKNIEILDLRRVSAVSIELEAFEHRKFPKLTALYLSGNNLAGMHVVISVQPKLLDLSYNTVNSPNPMYFEIENNTFHNSQQLLVLNLSFNRIKSIKNYTFLGLENLKMLNIENGTIYHIGPRTFVPMPRLEVLNIANNPLTESANFTSEQFAGLTELKVLNIKNCGIKYIDEKDNLFKDMINLQHLILSNNQLSHVTAEMFKPLRNLRVLNLNNNFLIAWSAPIFFNSLPKPHTLLLRSNKITHFTVSMLEDLNYLIEVHRNSTEIDLIDNFYICDCSAMYNTYTWIEMNASYALKQYFRTAKLICSTPDLWDNKRVFEYLLSIKSVPCLMYDSIAKGLFLVQTTPIVAVLVILCVVVVIVARFRMSMMHLFFKGYLKFSRQPLKAQDYDVKKYKYDAFVSYCNDDRELVLEMITEMETKPPYLKLCVYERDFEIGSFISESILNSVNESKYVILIISSSFAKSQWCRWETQIAEYHRLSVKNGRVYDPLVLVKVGDIDSEYMTNTLRYLLKYKIYLTWNEEKADEFWNRLRKVLMKR